MKNDKKTSPDLLSKLTEHVPGVVYQFQLFPDGRACFPFADGAVEEIFELSAEQIREDATLAFAYVHPEDIAAVMASIHHSANSLQLWHCEFRVNLPKKGLQWRLGNSRPEKLEDGSVLWHGFMTDITRQKQTELELKSIQVKLLHASKMSTLGEMAAGVAHEVNNPLAIIQGKAQQMLQLSGKGQLESEKLTQGLERIEAMTHRISKIIKGLRAFSRNSEKDPFLDTEVKQIIEDTLELCFQRFKNNGIEFRVKDIPNIKLQCRATQVSQILLNLLNNAYDAISGKAGSWVELEFKLNENQLQIFVTDSGRGILKEVSDQMMQAFFTTKKIGQGTGLGLSISRGIAEDHGGNLQYIAAYPNTRFMVQLPLKQSYVKAKAA